MKLILLLFLGLAIHPSSQLSRSSEILDPQKKYVLSWETDVQGDRIDFDIIVETNGFVGLGISASGKMDGADIFIAGVQNGVPYSQDMHGIANTVVPDEKSDWQLVEAFENSTHTHLKVWRLLNTCDEEDFPITHDTTRLIWSYGETDDIGYHGVNRGTKSVNFLLPEQPEWNPSRYTRFDITTNFTMPQDETTYWCTVHRGPQLPKQKHHIVAFEAFFDNEEAQQHTHHFILTMCKAPKGQNASEIFEPHVGTVGNLCYAVPENQTLPFEFCREYLYVWAVGGKTTQFPDHVGYPFGESEDDIYYMLEVHYDNPSNLEEVSFKTGLTFYYTPELRPIDAGLMWTPYDVNYALIVPPNVPDFVISTHCSPSCTERFPSDGINIFNVLLHSHVAGRKMKFRHFRNDKELPWILSDERYDFNFQQNAHLWEEVKVLPGDQLTVECLFDSTDRNGRIVHGGYSTRDEMCEAIFWYYPKNDVVSCGSVYPLWKALEEYGVTNYTLIPESTEITMPWILEPESLAGANGMDFPTVLNTRYNWTDEFIEFMRNSRQYGQHEYHCMIDQDETYYGTVSYPSFEEYAPQNPCLSVQ